MERRPLIIVGAGPAGTASALFLQRQDPQLATRRPRPRKGAAPALEGVRRRADPTHAAVSARARCAVGGSQRGGASARGSTFQAAVAHDDGELCRVVRRDAFDASLVAACRAAWHRGAREREGADAATRGGRGARRDGSRELPRTCGHRRRRFRQHRTPAAGGSGRDCVGKAVMADVPVAAVRLEWLSRVALRLQLRVAYATGCAVTSGRFRA